MEQIKSYVRSGLKLIAGALVAHGLSKAGAVVNSEDAFGVAMAIIGVVWSHHSHKGDGSSVPVKTVGWMAAALLLIFTSLVEAQTNQLSTTVPQFYRTALDYMTKFNPDLDGVFTNNNGQAYMGVDSLQGGPVNLADNLGLSYNVWKLISLESNTRSSGIAGTLLSEGFGIGLNFPIHDAKLTLYAEGVANLYKGAVSSDKFCGEVGIRLEKALTARTFAYIGMAAQLPKNSQIFSAGAGFMF